MVFQISNEMLVKELVKIVFSMYLVEEIRTYILVEQFFMYTLVHIFKAKHYVFIKTRIYQLFTVRNHK